MSNTAYQDASEEDREHFIQCGTCGEWIDCRDLDEVFYHEDHQNHADVQYAGSRRIKP